MSRIGWPGRWKRRCGGNARSAVSGRPPPAAAEGPRARVITLGGDHGMSRPLSGVEAKACLSLDAPFRWPAVRRPVGPRSVCSSPRSCPRSVCSQSILSDRSVSSRSVRGRSVRNRLFAARSVHRRSCPQSILSTVTLSGRPAFSQPVFSQPGRSVVPRSSPGRHQSPCFEVTSLPGRLPPIRASLVAKSKTPPPDEGGRGLP
jgi:hypothetical protein